MRCKRCDKLIFGKPIYKYFCGHKCRNIYARRKERMIEKQIKKQTVPRKYRRGKRNNTKYNRTTPISKYIYAKKCLECGNEFSGVDIRLRKYCSEECAHLNIGLSGKNSPNWRGGITRGPYCNKFNEECRESNRNKFNRICFLCGKSEGRRKLSVHHIDYNKMQGCETEWQLVPLCGRCHSKTSSSKRDYYEQYFSTLLYIRKIIMGYKKSYFMSDPMTYVVRLTDNDIKPIKLRWR